MQAEINIPNWATHVVSDNTDMDRSPHPVDSSRVKSFRIRLPDDVYFEYAFIDGEGRMRADPGNDLRAANPWYPEVSAIVGPEYRSSEYADLPEEIASGRLDRHRLESVRLGGVRRMTVYTPHGHEDAGMPLVIVHDGTAFLRLAGLPRVLEALLAQGKARPGRLAFVEPADRSAEYGFNEEYRAFTLEELLPFLEARYPMRGEPLLMGASLGGLVSATMALLHPERFSGLATFSGAFLGTPGDRDFYGSDESWVLGQLKGRKSLPLRWYSEVGTIEWLTDVNREVHRELAGKAADHEYRERHAGHNWTNWRNGLGNALEFLLRP
ncbi:MAG TPA: alpha/beta hydrolase-fold protein [Trueperaceae bacterium]